MKKAENLFAVPFHGEWSDLGSWNSVGDEMEKDELNVSLSTNAHSIDCENSIIRSENENIEIVWLGLKDIIAIATSDAILIANKDHSQHVKAVQLLREKK